MRAYTKLIAALSLLALANYRVSVARESPNVPKTLKSEGLIVRFDQKIQEPINITHRETGESVELTPESAFRLELDLLEGTDIPAKLAEREPSIIIDARTCEIVRCEQHESANDGLSREIMYECPHGQILVEFLLGHTDHFLQKRVRFTPAFSKSYLLRRVSVQQFRFPTPPAQLVSFPHGRCMTHFVRGNKTSIFFGVQLPIEVEIPDAAASIDLGYNVNYRYAAGEPYDAEIVYWGAGRLTGKFAPPVPKMIDECRNSQEPPDLGESAAMLEMVRRLLPAQPTAIAITFNWWDGGTSRNGYGTGSTEADLAQDKKVLSLAKEQFGEFYTELLPWGGMFRDMPSLGPDALEPPTSPLQRQMIEWAREENIRLGTWAPMKGIMPWLGIHQYCPTCQSWAGKHGDYPYNCPANREFMDWYTKLQTALIRRDGYGGFGVDEYLPNPRTGLPCSATGHDHLPGDATYGYFVARRDLFRTMRREFGPDFILSGFRPAMDAGIWDAVYLDGVFTVSESFKPGGDEARYRSRIRHFYHFIPSYMDQPFYRPDSSVDIDYLMLSALAVSSRHIVYGIAQDESARQRMRYWYDWARAHQDIMMGQTTFLPDWPGGGKCDVYLRLGEKDKENGFLFVFNANDKKMSSRVDLNSSCGLTSGKRYRLKQVFPVSSRTWPTQDRLDVDVDPHQVLLLSIAPEDSAQ